MPPSFARSANALKRSLEHYEVAATLHNLAATERSLGNFTAAERCYTRALALKTRLLGENHPDTQLTRDNLARLPRNGGPVPHRR